MKLSITLILGLLLLGGCSSSKKPNWTEATIATGNVNRPTIAIDSTNETIYVTWIATKDTVSNVYLSELKLGSIKFSDPVRVNSIRGNAAIVSQSPPQVAVSPTGLVYVTWLNQTEIKGRYWPDLDIYVARSEDGGRTFAPGVVVDNPSFPISQGFHNMAVGPKGIVYISWLDSRAKDRPNEKTEDHSQSSSADHHSSGHHTSHMDMKSMDHMDMEGSSMMQIRVARSTNHAKNFEPSKIIASHTCECCRTSVAVGGNGNVYVAWRHIFGDNIRDIAVARSSDNGKSFSSLVRVHKDGWKIDGCPHDGPSIAVNNQGVAFAIWFTGAKGKAGVYIAKSEGPNLKFGKPTLLTRSLGTAQVNADVSKNGDFWFTWENPDSSSIKIGNYIDGKLNKSFAAIKHGKLPSIAATNKNITATYLDGDSVKVRVYRLKSY